MLLFAVSNHPNQIAVSKIDSFIDGGTFFLDFSRPLEIRRWLIIRNSWFGFSVGLLAPVIHQSEERGGYVISVDRSEPYFTDLRALWKVHYPSKRSPPIAVADGLQIIADFARQFPNDC